MATAPVPGEDPFPDANVMSRNSWIVMRGAVALTIGDYGAIASGDRIVRSP